MIRRRFLTAALALLWLANPLCAEGKKKLLLVAGSPDGHPAMTHEYAAGMKVLEKCLKNVPGLEVTVVHVRGAWKEGPELMARADGVVLFLGEGARWLHHDPKRLQALRKLAARKGGLAVLHWGMGTRDAKYIDGFLKLFGGCHGGPDRKYKVLEAKAKPAADHPITRGIGKFSVKDEFYYRLKFVKPAKGPRPVLRVPIDGNDETVAWSWERRDGGRSFGFSGLHFHKNWGLEEYRRLVAQGVLWTLDLPIPEKGLEMKISKKDLQTTR